MNLVEHCIFPDWPAPLNVRALQTTRAGGGSSTPYKSLNLGMHVGDVPLMVARNRMLLNLLLPSEPVWLEQVHGKTVVQAEAANCRAEADACVTRRKAAVCAVMTADCLPILFCDQQGTVVAAAHVGWKGLAAGVIEAAVAAMRVPGEHILAWLGPAISQAAFEVGADVRELFVSENAASGAAFLPHPDNDEKYYADLYALARMRLQGLGVTQVYGGDRCTYRESDTFFSYRRDGVTGRMATFIWME
ncbi:MAG: peptidoglycan editing factor PgeF [Gallionella sp.]|nr:peptidoglycan editing factor PgeF [Gallionella sp.]